MFKMCLLLKDLKLKLGFGKYPTTTVAMATLQSFRGLKDFDISGAYIYAWIFISQLSLEENNVQYSTLLIKQPTVKQI